MMRIRIVFADPNLKSYIRDISFDEYKEGEQADIRQNNNTPFPLIRAIQIVPKLRNDTEA